MAPRWSEDEVTRILDAQKQGAASTPVTFEGVCTDTRALTPHCLFVALQGERYDAHGFLADAAKGGAVGAVVQRGHPRQAVPESFVLFEVESTLAALGALGRAHRRTFKGPLGAVGGSNGKTTTKEMVGAILATRGPALKTEGNFNNEIGVPLTLFRLEPSRHISAVVEMGLNHPGEMARLTALAEPDAGLLTVVQPEHLEGLKSLEGVAKAEGELFVGLREGAIAVVNLDDPLIVREALLSGRKQVTFGRAEGANVRLKAVVSLGLEGMDADISASGTTHRVRLSFLGEHNALNACGAFALGLALGFSAAECVKGLQAARPYARRLNVLRAPGDLTVIDDCYNANPASMNAALETVVQLARAQGGRSVAVLGDMLELGPEEMDEHATLGEVAKGRAQVLAFFGPRSLKGFERAQGADVAHFLEVEPLLTWLKGRLLPKDVVLVKGSRGMRLERVVEALTGQKSSGGH